MGKRGNFKDVSVLEGSRHLEGATGVAGQEGGVAGQKLVGQQKRRDKMVGSEERRKGTREDWFRIDWSA